MPAESPSHRQRVLLLGASGRMGFAAFQELWARRDASGARRFNVSLLVRPSHRNKAMFAPFERECGVRPIKGAGLCADPADSFRIVWGDALNDADLAAVMRGADWVLCPMALISPQADHDHRQSEAVNVTAIEHVVRAIEAQPGGAEHIRFIYTGTIAATGDRLPPVHWGRIGDPLKPSVFDYYSTTKIRGERAVIESRIKHWAVLRQTFIMVPDIMHLRDPIMFHQPLNTCMENITARDAGRGLINCLDTPDGSDFWRRVYHMNGGPSCRIVFRDLLQRVYALLGIDFRRVLDPRWFALRNFHMHYCEDAHVLNAHLHHWHDSIATALEQMRAALPWHFRAMAALCRLCPPARWLVERLTRLALKRLAEKPDGTLGWLQAGDDRHITAFFGSPDRWRGSAGWDGAGGITDAAAPPRRLHHGYVESKPVLGLDDLRGAAAFRGGACLSSAWSGDMHERLRWRCAEGHEFEAKPFTVLKAGHWCPVPPCLPPPWDYDAIARRNPFFAQVWHPYPDAGATAVAASAQEALA